MDLCVLEVRSTKRNERGHKRQDAPSHPFAVDDGDRSELVPPTGLGLQNRREHDHSPYYILFFLMTLCSHNCRNSTSECSLMWSTRREVHKFIFVSLKRGRCRVLHPAVKVSAILSQTSPIIYNMCTYRLL